MSFSRIAFAAFAALVLLASASFASEGPLDSSDFPVIDDGFASGEIPAQCQGIRDTLDFIESDQLDPAWDAYMSKKAECDALAGDCDSDCSELEWECYEIDEQCRLARNYYNAHCGGDSPTGEVEDCGSLLAEVQACQAASRRCQASLDRCQLVGPACQEDVDACREEQDQLRQEYEQILDIYEDFLQDLRECIEKYGDDGLDTDSVGDVPTDVIDQDARPFVLHR